MDDFSGFRGPFAGDSRRRRPLPIALPHEAFLERDARSPPEHRLLSSGRANGISSSLEREYLVPGKSWNAMSQSAAVRRRAKFKPGPRHPSDAAGIAQNLTRKARRSKPMAGNCSGRFQDKVVS